MLKIKMQKTKMTLKGEHDLKQCAHIFRKRSQSHLVESSGTKQCPKSSYTIPKGPLEKNVVNKPKER
jgi:hypothetical protein